MIFNKKIKILKEKFLKIFHFNYLWNSPTFTTWGNFFSNSVKNFIILAFILNRFASEEVAVFMLFATIISFSTLLDFAGYGTFSRLTSYIKGGATSLDNFRTKKNKIVLEGTNWPLMKKLYGTIGYVFTILSAGVFIIISSFGTWSVNRVISFTENPTEMWYAWMIVLISITIGMYGRKYTTILHGLNYIPLINRWNIVISTLTLIFSFATVIISNSLLNLIIVMQFFRILTVFIHGYLVNYYIENKRFKNYKSFSWDKNIFNAAWGPSWRSMIVIISSTGVIELSGIIYAQIGNADYISSYLLAIRLINIISNVSRAPFYSKLPLFATLRARGELTKLSSLTNYSITITLYTFIISAFFTGLLINPSLNFISSSTAFIPMTMWALMSLVWFVERHHAVHAQIYSTTNHIPFYIPVGISGVINILLALLLVNKIGYWAFPIAQGISNLIINNWWNVKISLKSINQPVFKYLKLSFFIPLLVLILSQLLLMVIYT